MMAVVDTRAARVLFTALLFAAVLAFLYLARHTLVVFLFAIFFAYLLEPLVSHLQVRVRGRGRAIALIYLALIVLVTAFFSFVGPRIGREGARLSESLPSLLEKVSTGNIVQQ